MAAGRRKRRSLRMAALVAVAGLVVALDTACSATGETAAGSAASLHAAALHAAAGAAAARTGVRAESAPAAGMRASVASPVTRPSAAPPSTW